MRWCWLRTQHSAWRMDVLLCTVDVIFPAWNVVEGCKELAFEQGLRNGDYLHSKQCGNLWTQFPWERVRKEWSWQVLDLFNMSVAWPGCLLTFYHLMLTTSPCWGPTTTILQTRKLNFTECVAVPYYHVVGRTRLQACLISKLFLEMTGAKEESWIYRNFPVPGKTRGWIVNGFANVRLNSHEMPVYSCRTSKSRF